MLYSDVGLGLTPSNKHLLHAHEKITPDESRPYLVSPEKPRLDLYGNISGYLDRKARSPLIKMQKM